jgi:allantoinase
MSYDMILTGGTVVTSNATFAADIGVIDGKISVISSDLSGVNVKNRLDLTGHFILPGCIDPHMHLWEPGLVADPDFRAGTIASAAGGITTIIDHPLTIPEVLTAEIFRDKVQIGENSSYVDFALHGGVNSANLKELPGLWQEGCTAFKIFMCESGSAVSMMEDGPLYDALKVIGSLGGTVIVHAENDSMLRHNRERLEAEGRTDYMAFVEWRTPEVEIEAIHRVIFFAERTGAKLVILHTTVPEGVSLAEQARHRGAKVWVETCPHILYLTHDDLREKGPWVTFAPPLRDTERVSLLWKMLSDGLIQMVGSDHGAVEKSLKEAGLSNIWTGQFGVPGAETLVPLMVHAAIEGWISFNRLVQLLSETPARVYGLFPQKGTIQVGSDADFTIINPEEQTILRAEDMYTSCNWIPYEGKEINGKVTHTIIRGKMVMEDGKVLVDPGFGTFVKRQI